MVKYICYVSSLSSLPIKSAPQLNDVAQVISLSAHNRLYVYFNTIRLLVITSSKGLNGELSA